MDRKALARRAYNTAVDRIARDNSLTLSEKRARWFRLSHAYEARKSQLDMVAFFNARGLGFILDQRA